MLEKILAVAGLSLTAVLAWAATQPDTFSIQRSATIHAPPETIYPLVADFHAWTAWSPYEKMDPQLARTYSGAESGLGAVYEWAGDQTGSGRMEFVEVEPNRRLTTSLDFTAPFEAHNVAEFTFEPRGADTVVTWKMSGENAYVAKVMHLFFDMDAMLGANFEQGLGDLKVAAEGGTATASRTGG